MIGRSGAPMVTTDQAISRSRIGRPPAVQAVVRSVRFAEPSWRRPRLLLELHGLRGIRTTVNPSSASAYPRAARRTSGPRAGQGARDAVTRSSRVSDQGPAEDAGRVWPRRSRSALRATTRMGRRFVLDAQDAALADDIAALGMRVRVSEHDANDATAAALPPRYSISWTNSPSPGNTPDACLAVFR